MFNLYSKTQSSGYIIRQIMQDCKFFSKFFLKKCTRWVAPAPGGAMEGRPPVLCVHHVHSTFPPVGTVHCAEHMVEAWPTGNTGNTKNTGLSTGMRVSHVPWNFRSTWPAVCHRLSIVFPVFIVLIVGLALPLCSAQSAPPTNRPRYFSPLFL